VIHVQRSPCLQEAVKGECNDAMLESAFCAFTRADVIDAISSASRSSPHITWWWYAIVGDDIWLVESELSNPQYLTREQILDGERADVIKWLVSCYQEQQ
jgi:hypothetical protein